MATAKKRKKKTAKRSSPKKYEVKRLLRGKWQVVSTHKSQELARKAADKLKLARRGAKTRVLAAKPLTPKPPKAKKSALGGRVSGVTRGVPRAEKKDVKKRPKKSAKKKDIAKSDRAIFLDEQRPKTKKKVVKKPTKKKGVGPKVFHTVTGSVQGFDEGDGKSYDRAMKSTHGNSFGNRDFARAIDAYFANFVEKIRVSDPDEVPIFRYGILIKSNPHAEPAILRMERAIHELAANRLPSGWAVHIVNEKNSLSVRIGMGSNDKTTPFSQVFENLQKNQPALSRLMTEIADVIDDGDWYGFVDIDDDWDYEG